MSYNKLIDKNASILPEYYTNTFVFWSCVCIASNEVDFNVDIRVGRYDFVNSQGRIQLIESLFVSCSCISIKSLMRLITTDEVPDMRYRLYMYIHTYIHM